MWFDLEEWVILMNDTINAGGSWYIVYDEEVPTICRASTPRAGAKALAKGDIQLYQ